MADDQRELNTDVDPAVVADSKERDSPSRREDRRSRSPRRDRRDDKPRRKDKGFKWKEKRRDDDEPRDRDYGLQRGYRDHYQPRARSRSPRRDRSPRRNEDRPERSDKKRDTEDADKKGEKKESKKDKKPAVAAPQQPMIIVTVNDRLGTKKAIPCFASDSVSEYWADDFDIDTILILYRGLQDHRRFDDWPATARDSPETPGRAPIQGPVDTAGLWGQQQRATGSRGRHWRLSLRDCHSQTEISQLFGVLSGCQNCTLYPNTCVRMQPVALHYPGAMTTGAGRGCP